MTKSTAVALRAALLFGSTKRHQQCGETNFAKGLFIVQYNIDSRKIFHDRYNYLVGNTPILITLLLLTANRAQA